MALKPTIFKMRISLSDLNKNHYDTLSLVVAQHPSETVERMMARVLAFCLNAQESLTFTKGLSSVEEPDIWVHTMDGCLSLWVDVGEPSAERIKKASRMAESVKVYCFNSKADVWWQKEQEKLKPLKASFVKIDWEGVQAFAGLVSRTMEFSLTITGDSAYIAAELGECEISWASLD